MKKILHHLLWWLLKAVAALPFWALHLLSNFTYYIMRYVVHYRIKVVRGNLERSFPEKSGRDIRGIANRFYRHLADCIFETIKLLHISDKQLEQHIKVVGGDLIERLAEDGRPIIVFLGHYGNWEWVQEVTRHYRRPAINAEIYRPLRDKAVGEAMSRIRARFDTTAIPQHQAVRTLLRMNREGKQFLVGFIADQRPNSKNLHHWSLFLNQDTAFATGGEEIGRHLNAHFVYLNVEKTSRSHYTMTFEEMTVKEDGDAAYPYTHLYLQLMEQTIKGRPEYWLWSHNRWKYDRNGNKIH